MDDDSGTTRWYRRDYGRAIRGRRAGSLFSLVWLAFPIGDLATASPSPLRVVLVAAGAAAFAAIYLRALWSPLGATTHSIAPPGLALAAIATALTLADRPSWSLLFVLIGTMTSLTLPERSAPAPLVGCAGLALVTGVLAGDDGNALTIAATTIGIGILMMGFARLLRSNEELLEARDELARLAVAEERLRFSRDLHDLLGHSLSVIVLKAELAERLLPADAERAARHVGDVRDVARAALGEVRDAVSGYRQPTLAAELAGARAALEAAGIAPELDEAEIALPPEAEAVLAWAVREGTTNVIRHSGAGSCRIAVSPGPAEASAEIIDDGNGGAGGSGHGLDGLRERVEHLAGRLEAGTAPGGGFRLRVTVPIAAAGP
jgi:two-component system, NarL family, sensor histidine kinase DesK